MEAKHVRLGMGSGGWGVRFKFLAFWPQSEVCSQPPTPLSRMVHATSAEGCSRAKGECSFGAPGPRHDCTPQAVLKKPHVNRRMANRALSAIDRLCTAHDTFRPHIHGTDLLPQFAGLVFPLCLFDARWNAAPILPLNLVREDTKHIFLRCRAR